MEPGPVATSPNRQCHYLVQAQWVLIFQMHFLFSFREVFKARDKNNKNLMVALKKVHMENEKEEVS